MRVVITGGAGFVGANLCCALTSADPAVDLAILDDFSTGYKSNLVGLPVTLYEGSVLDTDLLAEACAGADSIVHLAALASVPRSVADPVQVHEVNVTGTVRVLEAARVAGAHVIVASSSSVYGANPTLPKHEGMAAQPLNPYAASKLAAESYALAYQHVYGLRTLALRFFNIYGQLQSVDHAYAAVIPTFLNAALAGRPIPLHGDGRQTRDFTSVNSVVSVLVDAITRRISHESAVNLAFGTRTSLRELIALIADIAGTPLAVEVHPSRAGDVRDSQADASGLRQLFPHAQDEPLRAGLARTYEWFAAGASTRID